MEGRMVLRNGAFGLLFEEGVVKKTVMFAKGMFYLFPTS